jgi:hypothetical protein
MPSVNIETNLITYAILSASTELNALVSNRIYPMRAPQNANPNCITYLEISIVSVGIKSRHKNEKSRVQIDVFSETQSNAGAIAKAVKRAMLGQSLPGTFGGVYTQTIEFDDQQNFIEEAAEDRGMYRISQDYLIYYNVQD